ncbi:MAG: DUF2157 domain-containing protein [Bacteroidota bacterium]
MSIQKDLTELIEAGLISEDTAARIREYYGRKLAPATNRLFIVFGVLGALLVGLGIILIIAHNWDNLSRSIKTVFAFLPMLIGQGLCAYTLLKKKESISWRESSTVFLFLAVGSSISLVSQIYNIPGNISSFILSWMLLCLPLVYIMRSSITSLMYLIGITYYAMETGYGSGADFQTYLYWPLLMLMLPHYYLLYKHKPESNFMILHNWLVPISLLFVLPTIIIDMSELMLLGYVSLLGLFYLIGETSFFAQQKIRSAGYTVIGSLGTIGIMMGLSFDEFWRELAERDFPLNELVIAPEFYLTVLITLLAIGLLYYLQKGKGLDSLKPMRVTFLLFIPIFIIGMYSPVAVWLVNLLVFAIGILTIRDGAQRDHLGILNYGLLIITILIICRFFDTNLSFVVRGLLFVAVGAGFFATNNWMLKKRKTDE